MPYFKWIRWTDSPTCVFLLANVCHYFYTQIEMLSFTNAHDIHWNHSYASRLGSLVAFWSYSSFLLFGYLAHIMLLLFFLLLVFANMMLVLMAFDLLLMYFLCFWVLASLLFSNLYFIILLFFLNDNNPILRSSPKTSCLGSYLIYVPSLEF